MNENFCPQCGEVLAAGVVWFFPDDGVHGYAIVCSEACARGWSGSAPLPEADNA